MSEPARAQPYGVLVLHGLTSSLASVTPVADRLAQPEGEWAPFDRSGWRSLVYPDPHR